MTLNDNQSKRREYESYKPEETALTIAKPIPHIVNNESEVKPEDVILSYAEILNNPKNLTNANISKIEINFKSIDAKTDDEKLLLKNSLEYLEFLKTSLETALTIKKPIPHILNNESEVKPEDVILSYSDILNNPKNLTNANISKIEINFKSIDAKTDDEKLLLKNSLEYLEFLKTSSLTTGDLFCIDFSKENILSKAWAPKKIAMETIIEASPRSENPPIETSRKIQNIDDSGDRVGLEISVSPRNQTQSNSIFRIVSEEIKDNSDPLSQKKGERGIEPKVIIQSQKPAMKIFVPPENSLSIQNQALNQENNREAPYSPIASFITPPLLQNQTDLRIDASLVFANPNEVINSGQQPSNLGQQQPNSQISKPTCTSRILSFIFRK